MDEEIRSPEPGEPCPCGSGLSYGECCGRPEASEASGEVEVE
jgi:uncharacterized protein YchJ